MDPWTIERSRHPRGTHLLRVIDLERDEQRWLVVNPMPEGLDYELDGCTLIYPAREGRTAEERAHLVALYDELYRERAAEGKAA